MDIVNGGMKPVISEARAKFRIAAEFDTPVVHRPRGRGRYNTENYLV